MSHVCKMEKVANIQNLLDFPYSKFLEGLSYKLHLASQVGVETPYKYFSWRS
jgi:hypothetical protein